METEIIREIVAKTLNIGTDRVFTDTGFKEDLGADSIDVFRIVMNIEEKFGIILPRERALAINSVSDAIALIKGMK